MEIERREKWREKIRNGVHENKRGELTVGIRVLFLQELIIRHN